MIIGISGYARSGKDTAAEYLINKYEFNRVAFADPIREALLRLNPYVKVGGQEMYTVRQAVHFWGWDRLKDVSQNARELMQKMGTEVGREMIHPDIWVKLAMKEAKSYARTVITDVRYPNEAAAIRRAKGKIIRIVRPRVGPANRHPSENALDEYRFDFVINNDGFLEDLHGSIEKIMGELGLK